METLTAEQLRDALDYDPETGVFMWKDRPLSHFASPQAHASYTSRCAGKVAGADTGDGYLRVNVYRKKYLCHRLAWFYVYGKWPKQHIDHVNGDRLDNRIANLRDVSNTDNHRNVRMVKTNTSGVLGVRFDARHNRWAASISAHAKIHLGSFKTKEEAIAARKAAERQYGYHPNHGRAA
jgi:hypothetical protein